MLGTPGYAGNDDDDDDDGFVDDDKNPGSWKLDCHFHHLIWFCCHWQLTNDHSLHTAIRFPDE